MPAVTTAASPGVAGDSQMADCVEVLSSNYRVIMELRGKPQVNVVDAIRAARASLVRHQGLRAVAGAPATA